MTPRNMARDLWNHPATVAFCLSWIAVFAAMTYVEFADRNPFLTRDRWLVIGFPGGHRFGDLTLNELRQGQIWRLITCNFVHYSLIHITLNLLAMYQLGSMVEEWYGSYQFVFVYGLLGGLGNLVSAFIRIGVGANPQIHSGGGSVLIMGLVGMLRRGRLAGAGPLGQIVEPFDGVLPLDDGGPGDPLAAIHRQLGPCRRRDGRRRPGICGPLAC